ncbi:disease resistance protein RGA2-like [Hordeum vulgare subsp. vulgare]|uniref:AAA+ ATPase domain-containing protein n=1 Tax=Hordeum vulgare subsp. vulgare TaxID=112509 RepID=M0UFC1_HORVV|nr:disease resistance protein RGA2-like [Hordeum vulgare subsp. vulgare]XP_044965041.1 disease resistance protein RGA2-like [Hordeum vulgare subsp. vulgare]
MESAAIRGALFVLVKALSPLSGGLVEAWAATSGLGPNVEALKTELLYAQAMLDNARGREIRSHALAELLQKLRALAYGADDVLDELDYFRIQDELDGTFEAVDHDDRGCVHNLVRDVCHTAKAATKLLGCGSCYSAAGDTYKPEESCMCVRRLASHTRTTVHDFGKRLLCSSHLSVRDDSKHAPRVPKLKFDRVDVSTRMKCITDELKPLCAKVSTILGLELSGSVITELRLLGSSGIGNVASKSRPITTSQALEHTLYGREPQKNTIIEHIINDEYIHEKLTVIPIVGPGGIGKTTLTQYIYNNKEVQDHFKVRVWICVSLDFSVHKLTQEIVSSIPKAEDEKEKADSEVHNLDQLQKLIEKRLKNKRFLFVLDDIWKYGNEDEWKRFLIPFHKEQGNGDTILVTTRFLEVAEMVKQRDKPVHLEGLEPKEYWTLFLACVFGETNQRNNDDDLIEIGKKIVEKLKGSPLAAKTVGRLLRNNISVDHWTRVLESKEWESQTSDHDIMPALKVSYDYLPFHLQQCFSPCALFPEDYKFDCEELIHFWIGLDIIHPDNRIKRIEDIGRNNLNDLVNYGFFKIETGDSGKHYVIHDLLHDLALQVSSQESLHMSSSSTRALEITPSVHHLSISMSDPANSADGVVKQKFMKELNKIRNVLKTENLRTLMLFGDYNASFIPIFSDLFKDAKCLRVVYLSTMFFPVEFLLHNFSKLVHLRYLRLVSHYDSTEHVPKSIPRFYQLRVVDISDWWGGKSSVEDIANLVKLRHFFVRNYKQFHSNISNVGKLHNLQELQRFEVRKETNGFELMELGKLEEIGGSLDICNLENALVNEAPEANLLCKNRLQKLTLSWNMGQSKMSPDAEDQLLESLRPHSNLHELCIRGHGGSTCPTWLGKNLSIKGLEALRLDNVAWKLLPPLGELYQSIVEHESGEEYFGCITSPCFRNMKRLELIGLPKFRRWVATEVCPWYFSHIEVLIVEDCSELTELPFSSYTSCGPSETDSSVTWFPRLNELQIKNCPKLLSLPPIPYSHALCSVALTCAGRGRKELLYSSKSYSLKIEGSDDLHSLDETVLAFHNLSQLQKLIVIKCPPLTEKHLQMLTSLKTLRIGGSNSMLQLPRRDAIWQLPVTSLTLWSRNFSGKEVTRLLTHLPELSNLRIYESEKITRLGVEAEQQQTAAALSLSASPASIELQDTHGEDEHQERMWGVEEEGVAEEVVLEPEEDDDGLLLLPASLQELFLDNCPELILTAKNDETGGGGGLQAMRSLKNIEIANCPKFLSAYMASDLSSCCPFPSSLQHLLLSDRMEGMDTLVLLSNLTSLENLSINHLGEDFRCEGLLHLLTQGQLTALQVWNTPELFADWDPAGELQGEQLLPFPKLQQLETDEVAGVLTAPICRLLSSSLTKLSFQSNEDECFTKEQEEALFLLTSLQDLEFMWCSKLRCLPAGLNKLPNLKRLEIYDWPAIRSLPKNGLPSSLQELVVGQCIKLWCLPAGLHRLTNLKTLRIAYCPAMRSLPKNGLPNSLQELDVSRCKNKELIQRCRRLMGTISVIRL